MIKRQSRWIALLVVVAFAWMAHLSTMPLSAAAEAATVAAEEVAGPNYVEVADKAPAKAKPKSILPYVLIGVGAAALAVVLLVVLKKTTYDITGSWTLQWKENGDLTYETVPANFSGTKKSGTVSGFYGDSGSYTVDGKNVRWVLSSYDADFVWVGQFDSKDTMSGTLSLPSEGLQGTWIATRGAPVTALPGQPKDTAGAKGWTK
jgi:hypothetical protein